MSETINWGAILNSYYGISDKKENKKESKVDSKEKPRVIEETDYYDFVEDHIVDEPEQEIKSDSDCIEKSKASIEEFESVLGELPDADPTPRPEEDASYTKEEATAIKIEETKTGKQYDDIYADNKVSKTSKKKTAKKTNKKK